MRRNSFPLTLMLLMSPLCMRADAQSPAPLVPMAPAVAPVEPPEPPPTYPFHDQTPLFLPETECWAYLLPRYSVVKPETPLTLHLTFENVGQGRSFYNPYFHGLIPKPGMLAVYNTRHELVNDLIAFGGHSQKGPGIGDWRYVDGQSYVGFKIYNETLRLSPGTYYLQMIYFRPFAYDQPGDNADMGRIFESLYDQHEIFRSNPVTVKVLAPKLIGGKRNGVVRKSPKV